MKFSSSSALLLAYAMLPAHADVFYSEDFDGGDGGFVSTESGGSTFPWMFNAPTSSWRLDGDDNLGSPTSNLLTSPAVVVPGTEMLKISFNHRYSIEIDWDGGGLFVAVNGGEFTRVESAAFTQGGYRDFPLIGNHVLSGVEGFNGDSPGYPDGAFITSTAVLPAVGIGDTIQIQFVGAYDEFARGSFLPNWEIDGVTMETLTDTDGDGIPDGYEDENGLDKTVDDSDGDLDSDTVTNLDEYLNGTDPRDEDSDDDGLADSVETGAGVYLSASDTGTDPLNPDTDGDGLGDGLEDNSLVFAGAASPGTNPNSADTDGDGFDDGDEIIAGTNPLLAGSFPAIPLVIGYWPFDDQTSPTLDLSPGANHGTVNGGATFVAGHTGEAGDSSLDFDGVDDSVTTAVSLLSGLAEYTMSGWVKFDTGQQNRTGFFGQNDAVEYGMISATSMQYWTSTGGAFDVPFGPVATDWTHLLVTRNPTERKVYINGVESGSGTASANAQSSSFFFNIGGGGIFDAAGNFFLGQIDDVAVWDTVLTSTQIGELASKELTPLGPSDVRPFQIIDFSYAPGSSDVALEWNSRPNRIYAVSGSTDLQAWVELDDGVISEGATTRFVQPVDPEGAPTQFFRVGELP